jgi:antirestriction protein ArdC
MPTQSEIRQKVTDQIIAALERDLIPWARPWKTRGPGRHSNIASSNAYLGINPLILECHARDLGLASRWWGTFDQWKKLECNVRKRPDHIEPGHWAAQIVFFKPINRTTIDDTTGEDKKSSFPVLRNFSVFSMDQVEGEFVDAARKADENTDPIGPNYQAAEDLIEASGAEFHFGGDQACYHRPLPEGSWPNHSSGDFILIPNRSQFNRISSFYSVAMHELSHWTDCRLAFDYNKHGYAFCELISEIAACMVCAELGIASEEFDANHASYLKHWLEQMKGDSSYIFKASAQASKITSYLLSFVREPVTA